MKVGRKPHTDPVHAAMPDGRDESYGVGCFDVVGLTEFGDSAIEVLAGLLIDLAEAKSAPVELTSPSSKIAGANRR